MNTILTKLAILALSSTLFVACNNSGDTAATFCDTTCRSDSFNFNNDAAIKASVRISVKDCAPDSIAWTHSYMATSRQLPVSDLVSQDIRLHRSAIECVIRDTSHAWLSFNDCITGRGYLFRLPFNKSENISKISGALNAFDPKFDIADNLRAYTDRGSIFVVDVNSDKQAMMTFGESYDIDFNKIHEVVDTVHVSAKRIFVKLKKEGKEIPLEKTIDL